VRATFAVAAGVLVSLVLSGQASAETRTLNFYNTHTGERSSVTFKRDGVYDQAGLKQLNYVLRDWRRNQQVRMDPELADLVWEVYRESGASEPISIICGYRAPETNAMLRSRSRAVAKHSQHMLGKALDFNIPGVDLTKLRYMGMKKQFGGVGIYPSSNFVHMDVGSVRTWPNRLSREQLLALFPDGRTLHLPSDGKPLAGYNMAMADFQRNHPNRGGSSVGDEDETPTPIAAQPVAVAMADTRPAPAPGSAPEARASSTRIEAEPKPADLKQYAGVVPPVKPVIAAVEAPVVAFAGPMALPRPKPGQEAVGTTEIKSPPATRLALATGARPSPSAADALAILAGDPDTPATALGYAPPPAPRATADRTALERMVGEPVDTVASIAGGGVQVAALPPNIAATTRRDAGRPASKTDRADPLARLVAPAIDRPDPRLFVVASLARPAGSVDPLVRGSDDGLSGLLAKPRQVVDAGFRPAGPGSYSSFYGPAVAAVPTRSFE
jgi:uncharacterized protein YcbK (DUF882 family)